MSMSILGVHDTQDMHYFVHVHSSAYIMALGSDSKAYHRLIFTQRVEYLDISNHIHFTFETLN